MQDSAPIGVILVSSGSRGDKLLFRYPFENGDGDERCSRRHSNHRNPYALQISEDFRNLSNATEGASDQDPLSSFNDKILANILAVKSDLCGHTFELKIDNVLFVGFPMVLHTAPSPGVQGTSMISFNVVFALKSKVQKSAIACYHELSKRLAIAFCHEESRCRYLSEQTRRMLQVIEENAALPEDSIEIPFKSMVHRCLLAQHLKNIYENLRETGVVQLRINNWIEVSFCLPHIIHNISIQKGVKIEPEAIQRCLKYLRPYHAMLLLVDENTIVQTLPLDASPSLLRLLKITSPMKSLQNLAADTDLPLSQIFHLVCHLVYWAKATVIYPLCESNVYVLSPEATTYVNSSLVAEFVEEFQDLSLPAVLAEFSLPTPLGEHTDVLGLPQEQTQKVQIVVWMLRNRLLMQLHTYVYLMPTSDGCSSTASISTAGSMKSEDFQQSLQSGFDRISVSSDDGYSLSSGFSTISKSPSTIEVRSDGFVITDEVRSQQRIQDNLLSYLNDEEKRAIMSVPSTNNMDDLRLFSRLCPYFNGKHHLEEVMYYENIRRSQLMTLLDKFRQVLITCTHPDANTTYFVKM